MDTYIVPYCEFEPKDVQFQRNMEQRQMNPTSCAWNKVGFIDSTLLGMRTQWCLILQMCMEQSTFCEFEPNNVQFSWNIEQRHITKTSCGLNNVGFNCGSTMPSCEFESDIANRCLKYFHILLALSNQTKNIPQLLFAKPNLTTR